MALRSFLLAQSLGAASKHWPSGRPMLAGRPYRNLLAGATLQKGVEGEAALALGEIFAHLPIALLVAIEGPGRDEIAASAAGE